MHQTEMRHGFYPNRILRGANCQLRHQVVTMAYSKTCPCFRVNLKLPMVTM